MFVKLESIFIYIYLTSQQNIKSLSHRYWLLIHVCKMLLESLPGCNRSTLMVGGIRLIRWLCLRWWHHHQDGWLYALQKYWYQSVTPGWDEVAIMKHHETIDLYSQKRLTWKMNESGELYIFFQGSIFGFYIRFRRCYLCYMMLPYIRFISIGWFVSWVGKVVTHWG